MKPLCRIQLLGSLCVEQGDRRITRFRSQKTAALLGYLAYTLRPQPRETLLELFWPAHDLNAGRNSLNVALTSLRRQLEPPGISPGAVLLSDRTYVRLDPETCATDVAAFEAALQAVSQANNEAAQAPLLTRAVELYSGELLAGYFEEWILAERPRLVSAYLGALRRLVKSLALAQEYDRALDYAHRAIRADPLREVSYRDLMRLYLAVGRPAAALEQAHELERVLKANLGAVPSPATRELIQQILAGSQAVDSGSVAMTASATLSSTPSPLPAYPSQAQHSTEVGGSALPLPLTRFFGREEEIEQLLALPSRLITMTGSGGSGKTRLAIEVAGRLADVFSGAIWFVALADVTDPRRIPDSILNALNLSRTSEVDPLDQAVEVLSRQTSLLVLDNFEHLAEGRLLVRTLLERAPALKVMVTSRQSLGIAGEQEFPVMPLPTPMEREREGERGKGKGMRADFPLSPLSSLLDCPSVQLFVDRAQSKRPGFQVTQSNAASVAALCDRLEGIPLALELAAGWARTLTPEQMLERLSHRFDLLVSRHKDLELRHQSLRTALDGSYRLLEPELQRFFAHLSVFRGGWTLEAAEFVCSADEGVRRWVLGVGEETSSTSAHEVQPEAQNGGRQLQHPIPNTQHPTPNTYEVLELLTSLVDKSLVIADETWDSAQIRFHMLETVREYSQDRLREWGEARQVRARHLDYYLAFAEQAAPKLTGAEQSVWIARLEAEHENLRAALAWCLEKQGVGCRVSGVVSDEERVRGRGGEEKKADLREEEFSKLSSQASSLLFRHPTPDTRHPSEAGLRLSGALWRFWEIRGYLTEGRKHYADALAQPGAQGRSKERAAALQGAASLAHSQGDYVQARALYEESLAINRELEDKRAIAAALNNLGLLAHNQGDRTWARTLYEESLIIQRAEGNKTGVAATVGNLGVLAFEQGEYPLARALFEESLILQRELEDQDSVALALFNLAGVAAMQADYAVARSLYEQVLSVVREIGNRPKEAYVLRCLGNVAQFQSDYAQARTLYTQSLAMFRELQNKSGAIESLEACGSLAVEEGRTTCAARLWGAATALREAIDFPRTPVERAEYERDVAAARALLGAEAFTAAWTDGQDWTLEQAISYALTEIDNT